MRTTAEMEVHDPDLIGNTQGLLEEIEAEEAKRKESKHRADSLWEQIEKMSKFKQQALLGYLIGDFHDHEGFLDAVEEFLETYNRGG